MIIKSLYESLCKSINEALVNRTIDRKLWLSVASTCSRNKSTEAEFIKPLSRLTKEDLLLRYVAAIIIMKKKCPENILDIDDIKTFKFIGKRYIELGGSFKDIKNEYITNGGKIVTNTINTQSEKIEQKLNTEIKLTDEKPATVVSNIKDDKPLIKQRQLPEGVKDYNTIYDYAKSNFKTLLSICEEIYRLLDTTYYEIKKTFYKKETPKYNLYFRDAYTDDDLKVYNNNKHYIFISWVQTVKRNVVEGTFGILVNNMSINDNPIGDSILLDDNISISYDELTEICLTILAKLLYASLIEYKHPLYNKAKQVSKTWGNFDNKPRDYSEPVNLDEYDVILRMVLKKFNNYKTLHRAIYNIAKFDKQDNIKFAMPIYEDGILYYAKDLNKPNGTFNVESYEHMHRDKGEGMIFLIINSNINISDNIDNDTNNIVNTYSNQIRLLLTYTYVRCYNSNESFQYVDGNCYMTGKTYYIICLRLLALMFYYNNNYHNLLK